MGMQRFLKLKSQITMRCISVLSSADKKMMDLVQNVMRSGATESIVFST